MVECVGDVGAELGVSQLADFPRHDDGAQCAAALLRRAAKVNPLGLRPRAGVGWRELARPRSLAVSHVVFPLFRLVSISAAAESALRLPPVDFSRKGVGRFVFPRGLAQLGIRHAS